MKNKIGLYKFFFKINPLMWALALLITMGSHNKVSAQSLNSDLKTRENIEFDLYSQTEANSVLEVNSLKYDDIKFAELHLPFLSLVNYRSQQTDFSFSSYQLAQRDDIVPSDSEDDFFREIKPEDLIIEEESEEPTTEEIEKQQDLILDSLSNSVDKYPFIINPFDSLTVSEDQFSPDRVDNYSEFDIRFAEDNPTFKHLGFGHFPEEDQFYWSLSGNRIVFETQGIQSGLRYQGQTDEIEINEAFLLRQGFFGVQAIWTFPGELSLLEGDQEELDEFTVFAVAAEAGNVDLNLDLANIDFDDADDAKSIIGVGTGSSDRIEGGGSLFEQIDPANAPRILQAFPTVDLSPLVNGGNVPLEAGAIIPKENLEEVGLTFGSPLTTEVPSFNTTFSSDPGVKIGQKETFDNLDLLNVLVNPFLSETERDRRFLNSLFWAWLGQQQPEVFTQERRENFDWHRFYLSRSHDRSMLEYDQNQVSATYTNVSLNPGASISLSLNEGEVDETQSANATFGMLLGFPLAAFSNLNNLQGSLEEAKQEYQSGEGFTPLNTEATSKQRKQINQRLNQTLRTSDITSELEQVSGAVTFPSQVSPNHASVLQLRTGLHSRTVEFQEQSISTNQGQPFFSETRLSKDDFNLNFIGIPIGSSSDQINSNFTGQVGLISPDGQQFIEEISPEAPLPTRGFTLAFDRLEIARIDTRDINFNQFRGNLSLPSVELLWSGSSQDFNYGVSAGAWFNLDSDSAPGVGENQLGSEEPSAGVYLGSAFNWTVIRRQQNDRGNTIGINAHIPSFRVSWNSEMNKHNPFSAIASYNYIHQRRNYSFSLSPLIAYIPNGEEQDSTETDFIALLRGNLNFNTGLNINGSLEARDEFFYTLESTQEINSDIKIGGFISNFTRTLRGLSSRRSDFNFGPVIKVDLENQDIVLDARLGLGNSEPDFRIKGNARF
ncbi:MAG: hypothetical protein RI580_11835 [Halothece sp. Uz-M2-17]|nr:hypothetical protein [Halothece sp. Uz-M2-17]